MMENPYLVNLYILLNLKLIIEQKDLAGPNMFNTELSYLVYQEESKNRLREINRRHLLQRVKSEQGLTLKLYRQAVNWLGIQLVKWGTKLETYGSTTPEILTQDVKNHRLRYS